MKDRELFFSALEIEDPAARQMHLKDECGNDVALLARVEALLSSHESQSQFLNTPVVEQMTDAADAGSAATMLVGNGSTQDDELDVTAVHAHGLVTMAEMLANCEEQFKTHAPVQDFSKTPPRSPREDPEVGRGLRQQSCWFRSLRCR